MASVWTSLEYQVLTSDHRSASSDESSVDSAAQSPASPSRGEYSGAFGSELSQTHIKTDLGSGALSSATFPQGTHDGHGASQ